MISEAIFIYARAVESCLLRKGDGGWSCVFWTQYPIYVRLSGNVPGIASQRLRKVLRFCASPQFHSGEYGHDGHKRGHERPDTEQKESLRGT